MLSMSLFCSEEERLLPVGTEHCLPGGGGGGRQGLTVALFISVILTNERRPDVYLLLKGIIIC